MVINLDCSISWASMASSFARFATARNACDDYAGVLKGFSGLGVVSWSFSDRRYRSYITKLQIIFYLTMVVRDVKYLWW